VAAKGGPKAGPKAGGAVSVGDIEFIGSVVYEEPEVGGELVPFTYAGVEIGGLSGIVYDAARGVYHALSDDKSQVDPARFFTIEIDLSDGTLDDGDVEFVGVTFLRDMRSRPFEEDSLDPEGFELVRPGQLFIGSERDLNDEPWIARFNTSGKLNKIAPLPGYYFPEFDGPTQTDGVYLNLAFESLTVTPDGRYLYGGTENALAQDGPVATFLDESPARVIQYRLAGMRPMAEYVYHVSTIPVEPTGFGDNGLVELQALDNVGTFLAMERSFVSGFGNTVRLFETSTDGATDVSGWTSIMGEPYTPMSKELVYDFADTGAGLDNFEGMAFGPMLPDGRYPLIVVSDNNFNIGVQNTIFFAFAVELEK
jgi:3-phytase/alkaline phosphatase D